MTKLLTLSIVLFFSTLAVFAQTRSVTGKITDEKGEPIPFATIVIKGHRQGVSADQNGVFVARINPGETLVFSATGYAPKDYQPGSESTINLSLSRNQGAIEEVVVTALGIKRTKIPSLTPPSRSAAKKSAASAAATLSAHSPERSPAWRSARVMPWAGQPTWSSVVTSPSPGATRPSSS